ncbi:MAG: rhodanese-like domain-containing protein [Epsilonproteobacteria bacterium]|nr:sulfurtransferase [Campylobacterota bacterium]NPA56169.1 rhodanese-like domain-containing protein [Campylobacterota bacterium]
MVKKVAIVALAALIGWSGSGGEDLKVKITENLPYVDVEVNGKIVRIQRIQDTEHKLRNSYIRTSRPAPPFYVQEFKPVKGIDTVGELELLNFLKDKVNLDKGLLVDARMPKWYRQGTIPGAVNIPFSLLYEKRYADKILSQLGVKIKDGKRDFSNATELMIFDNGPWCQQAVREIKNLVELGYPKEKIHYYRGGMQYWQILGLTTLKPE